MLFFYCAGATARKNPKDRASSADDLRVVYPLGVVSDMGEHDDITDAAPSPAVHAAEALDQCLNWGWIGEQDVEVDVQAYLHNLRRHQNAPNVLADAAAGACLQGQRVLFLGPIISREAAVQEGNLPAPEAAHQSSVEFLSTADRGCYHQDGLASPTALLDGREALV